MAINVSVHDNGGFLPSIVLLVDPMLLPYGNPCKCHEEVLYLQPMIPPKRFDIFPPDWGMLRGMLDVCVCVCFFPFILDIKFVGRTSRGHTGGRSQDFSSTFFLRCVPSFFSREGFSHSFPSSTVMSNFVY